MVRTKNVTILLSTHYIEEARQASVCGFMRNGKLLAQDTPQNIIDHLGTSTLEEAFQVLCKADKPFEELQSANIDLLPEQKVMESANNNNQKVPKSDKTNLLSTRRMKALLIKNVIQMIRTPMLVVQCIN